MIRYLALAGLLSFSSLSYADVLQCGAGYYIGTYVELTSRDIGIFKLKNGNQIYFSFHNCHVELTDE